MRRKGGVDWWHNPSGWMLLGVLLFLISQERQWITTLPLLNACVLGTLVLSIGYLLRSQTNVQGNTGLVLAGIALATLTFILNQTPLWPEHYPPREYHGQIVLTRIMPSGEGSSTLRGTARLHAPNDPVWNLLHNAKIHFSLAPKDDTAIILYAGQRAQVSGVLRPLDPPHLRTGFQNYLYRQDILIRLIQGHIQPTPPNLLIRFREWCKQRLLHALQVDGHHRPREQAAYVGMLLGDTSYLSREDNELYRISGTLHLFAISGMHIAILAGGLFMFLQLLRLPGSLQTFIGVTLLGGYVWITGAAPSAVRSWLMISLFWSGHGLLRKPNSWRSLTASALILLLLSPNQINHLGFQLSYSVVAAILLWGIPVLKWLPLEKWVGHGYPNIVLTTLQQRLRILIRILWSTLVIGIAATLGSFPWILAHFGLVTPGGVLINLPASVVSSGVMLSAMLSMGGGLLGIESLSGFFNQSSLLLMALFIHWIEFLVPTPGFSWQIPIPPSPALAATLVIIGILLLIGGRTSGTRLQKITCILFPVWIIAGCWWIC